MQDGIAKASSMGWRQALRVRGFRFQLAATIAAIAGIAAGTPYFFDYIESRSGPVLPDPLLDVLPGRNVSWLVFFILYSGVVVGLYANSRKPVYLLLSMQTYVFVMFMRCLTLTLFPLDPPPGYIPLREPVVQMFFTSDGRIISRDLFFSGHMSTLLALVFTVGRFPVRSVLIWFTCILAMLLLIQHVHYTIDILYAPIGAGLSYLMARKVVSRMSVGL